MFAAGKTAAVSGSAPDDKFNYVTMLLHGDGTNGAQNNTFVDSSTNNFSITRNGNTTQGSFSPYGSNWSNYFDGDGDYLTIPDNSAFTLGTSNFTIEFLVYPLSGGGTSPIIFEHGQSGDWGAWIFQWISQNEIYFYAASSAGAGSYNVCNQSFGTLTKNQWTHICVTRNGSTFTGYKNGTSVFTSTSALGIQDQTAPVTIGRHYNSTAQDFNGYVSNARIVVGSVVTPPAGGPTSPLTAVTNTVLLTCQSNRFIDNSTNNYTLTATGTPSVQRFNPFGASTDYSTSVIGGSGYFDGDGDYLQATAGAVPAIGTSDFTISGWWYLNELKNYQILLDFRNGTGTEAVPYMYVGSTGSADYFVDGTSHTFTIPFKVYQWYYIVISRVSGTTKVFVNGSEVVSYSDSVTYVAGRLNLGFNNNGGTAYYYNGYISDFKVVIGTGTTSGTPTTAPATATSGTQALLSMTNGAIFDNAMMTTLETVGNAQISTSVKKYGTGSIAFDGTGDYLKIPNSPNLQFGTGAYTLEFWLNTSSVSQWLVFSAENNTGIRFYVQSNGTLELDEQVANADNNIYSTATVNDGAWHHIALSRASGAGTKMFVDGVYQSQQASAYNFNDSVPYYIGTRSNLSGFLTGYIDDMRITKGFARYTANFTPPTAAFSDTGPY